MKIVVTIAMPSAAPDSLNIITILPARLDTPGSQQSQTRLKYHYRLKTPDCGFLMK